LLRHLSGLQLTPRRRISEDKDSGRAISLWENLADMDSYEQSAPFKVFMALLQRFFMSEHSATGNWNERPS
jgi:hypothetical protein